MRFQHLGVIHVIELVAAEDQNVFAILFVEVSQILADGVGGTFVPFGPTLHGLLSSQKLDKSAAEVIEPIRLANVLVKRNAEELGHHVDLIDTAVQAVADRNIDQSIFAGQRNGRFRSDFCERIKAGSSTTTENQRNYLPHVVHCKTSSKPSKLVVFKVPKIPELIGRGQQRCQTIKSSESAGRLRRTVAAIRSSLQGNSMNVVWEPAMELVTKLVRFPSVSHESNEDVSQAVADELFRIGFEVEWLSYRDHEGKTKVSLVAKRGEGTGGVAYLAHTDVVPAEDWSLDFCGPFEPVLRDGKLYGRGTCDMKGSLACALTAAAQTPVTNGSPLYFIVTSDEEIGMHGARLVNNRSRLFEEMVATNTIGIVGEPTQLEVVHAHKGGLRFHVFARGKSAHTSTPDGINANYALIPALEPLLQLRSETEEAFQFRNEMFNPPTLSWNMTITNEPEAVNVTTSLAQLNNFLRLMPDVDIEPIMARVEQICDRYHLELARSDQVEPWSVSPESSWIQQMLSLVGRSESRSVCYATDAGVLQRLRAMMICGPGDIQQAHRSDEWISLEQLKLGVETYTRAFCSLQATPLHGPTT